MTDLRKEALAQPEQEPVAWVSYKQLRELKDNSAGEVPIYLRPAPTVVKQEPVVECKDDGEGGVYYVTLVNTAPIGKLYAHPVPTVVKQEPVAWMVHGGEIWNTSVSPYRDERGIPLYAHPTPIPKGWHLVPIEPTRRMEWYCCNCDSRAGMTPETHTARDAYKAMLAAAPKPEDV